MVQVWGRTSTKVLSVLGHGQVGLKTGILSAGFPYFLVGAAVAALASVAGHGTNFGTTLLVVPTMYFVYVYYKMHIVRVVLESISSVSREDRALLSAASQGR